MIRPRLLITRPAAEQERTAEAARRDGFEPVAAPLMTIEEVAFNLPADLPTALLFTSARAPALAARRFPALLRLPAWAVGAHTADAVLRAGFSLRGSGDADGSAIVAAAAKAGETRLLHLAGEDTAALRVPSTLSIERRVAYRAVACTAFPEAAIGALRNDALVLLLSPRSAALFAELHGRAGLDRERNGLAVISAAAARAAGDGWRGIAVAETPDLAASLAATRLLWHKLHDA